MYLREEVDEAAVEPIPHIPSHWILVPPGLGDDEHQSGPDGHGSEDVVKGKAVVDVLLLGGGAPGRPSDVPKDGAMDDGHESRDQQEAHVASQIGREGKGQGSSVQYKMVIASQKILKDFYLDSYIQRAAI